MASITLTVEIKDVEVDVEVTFNPGWFQRGCRSGHPDNWTPDEGEAAEIEKITLTLGSGRVLDVTNKLTDRQRERVQRACDEWEYPEPDYEPDDEPFYDD